MSAAAPIGPRDCYDAGGPATARRGRVVPRRASGGGLGGCNVR